MSTSLLPAADRHTPFEDVQALLIGTLFISLGVVMFKHAGLLSGGTAGLAFLLHYAGGWGFGQVFFLLNLPFYWLARRKMGRAFTLKTVAAVALLSVFTELHPLVLRFERLEPAYAAVLGGLVIGTGMLMLMRHRASLGGVGVLVFYLQESHGWRAGKVQLAIDGGIVALAVLLVEPRQVLYSLLGAVALNGVLAVNHRPGRYLAM
ncbi:YitT family protein [Aquabacterium sp. A7-Y]|uniref:YitT family protein n=1 Tax=Aquabacterium sp. A7-Y TaxID=1349605 RepID=UPI00223E60F8|nr:YitT family protein [Aquabacterium sp. A7-Y]MCW7537215.1 YitT family protein [Aquabacterium sp. A7-Y]